MPHKHPQTVSAAPGHCSAQDCSALHHLDLFFLQQQQPGPAMVTGFPGRSECCIFPAVRKQQVSSSLTPSPEPLAPRMWGGIEHKQYKKSQCALPGHCCISTRHCCHLECPQGLPRQPTWSSGRAQGLFNPTFLGIKPS